MEKKSLKDWLYFSKKEKNALIFLVLIVALFFLIPILLPKKKLPANITHTLSGNKSENITTNNVSLFLFDPNTIDSTAWKKLGVRDKVVRTILHYREKGGRFRKPEDIRKIYGLAPEIADKLIPYIRIGENNHNNSASVTSIKKSATYTFPIEINKAGAEHWAALPGISSQLAQRIVHFREAIHGFKSVEQVGKTYGLRPTIFAQIQPFLRLSKQDTVTSPQPSYNISEKETVAKMPIVIEKININTASEQEILSQKRIPKNVAKAIVIYREQHGDYQDIADVKNIVFINDEIYSRIAPYITTQ